MHPIKKQSGISTHPNKKQPRTSMHPNEKQPGTGQHLWNVCSAMDDGR